MLDNIFTNQSYNRYKTMSIDDIDIKFPQCIMVAYRGCYAMISP